jgi:hypothetical protein
VQRLTLVSAVIGLLVTLIGILAEVALLRWAGLVLLGLASITSFWLKWGPEGWMRERLRQQKR